MQQGNKPNQIGGHIGRRQFLLMSTSALALGWMGRMGAVAATAMPTSFSEAPMLAKLVEAGKLPKLADRMPEVPMVVPVVERTGDYGGDWRTALLGGQDGAWQVRTLGYENLLRWTVDWTGWIPNVAESYEVSPDSREFTFKLRKGMRWSDGQPYTADDIMFWYEDVYSNDQLTPIKPPWLVSGGKPVVVTKVDDYQVKFTFAEPNGLFLLGLTDVRGARVSAHPRHYFEQFHPRYNKTNLDEMVKNAGVANWVALFELKGGGSSANIRWWNRELPTVNGWVITIGQGDSTTQMVAERNPYYWKVDPDGNQLPYVDRIIYDFVNDEQVLLQRALAGKIDMMDRHIATATNKSVLYDNQQQGGYHFIEELSTAPNTSIICLNLTHKDKAKRDLYNNKDFRIGLSYAINRQEIIDTVFVSQGEPAQVATLKSSPYYIEQLAKQYTEFDVDKANQYLDKAGLTKRDGKGFRLTPDGNQVTLVIDVYNAYQPLVDTMQLVTQYWMKVGINALLRPGDRSLVGARVDVGDFDVFANKPLDGGGGQTAITNPQNLVPTDSLAAWGQGWASWYAQQHGVKGQAVPAQVPPEAVQKQLALYDRLTTEGDQAQQTKTMLEILQVAADEFYNIGISTEAPGYAVVKNDMHNVPKQMFASYSWPTPAASNTVQYFFEGGHNS